MGLQIGRFQCLIIYVKCKGSKTDLKKFWLFFRIICTDPNEICLGNIILWNDLFKLVQSFWKNTKQVKVHIPQYLPCSVATALPGCSLGRSPHYPARRCTSWPPWCAASVAVSWPCSPSAPEEGTYRWSHRSSSLTRRTLATLSDCTRKDLIKSCKHVSIT